MNVYKILFIFLIAIILFNCTQDENINEVAILEKMKTVTGSYVGIAGSPSKAWLLYRKISSNYSSELVEREYYKTDSLVAKIYLYWVLRERNSDNLSLIYNDLMKYESIKLSFNPGGCCLFSETVKYITNYRIEERD